MGAPGVEVILSGRIRRDLAVFLTHLPAQRLKIDHIEYFGHRLVLVIACRMICLKVGVSRKACGMG